MCSRDVLMNRNKAHGINERKDVVHINEVQIQGKVNKGGCLTILDENKEGAQT